MLLLSVALGGCAAGLAAFPRSAAQDPGPVQTITGRERVAWDQELLPNTSIDSYEFGVYVNDERATLAPVRCNNALGADAMTCSAALPPLPPGRSTLEFVAVLDAVESERSDPLEVQVETGEEALRRGFSAANALRVDMVTGGLQSPTDLALLPDGRMLIAERHGSVRVVAAGALQRESALVLAEVAENSDLRLFAIAAHPDFARNRFVYLAYTARDNNSGAAYRVVRTREINNTLGEAAIVYQSTADRGPGWISMRFGPDGKLYIGVASCDDCRPASAGAVLRLDDDGSAPRDAASPFYVRDVKMPVALSWLGEQLLIADWSPQSTALLMRQPDGSLRVAASTEAGALLAQGGADLPAAMLTRPDGAGLHRFQLPLGGPVIQRDEQIVDDGVTVHAVVRAADGALYVCVSASGDRAARLMRVTGWR